MANIFWENQKGLRNILDLGAVAYFSSTLYILWYEFLNDLDAQSFVTKKPVK